MATNSKLIEPAPRRRSTKKRSLDNEAQRHQWRAYIHMVHFRTGTPDNIAAAIAHADKLLAAERERFDLPA